MVKVVPQPFGQREVTLAGDLTTELSSRIKFFVKRLGIDGWANEISLLARRGITLSMN